MHAVSSTENSKENMKYFILVGFDHQAQVWELIYAIYVGTTVFIALRFREDKNIIFSYTYNFLLTLGKKKKCLRELFS